MSSNQTKVALLCAYTLARAGHYGEAEALILSDGELSKTTEAMDLLARIRAEQGDEGEARRLWQEIQLIHPEHAPSRKALKALGKTAFVMPWKALCLLLAPLFLAAGMVVGFLLAERKGDWQVTWEGIPRTEELKALEAYHGRTEQVLISTRFFSVPERLGHRALLSAYIAEAVGVPPEAIFIGDAPEATGERITLTLVRAR
ncbi:MAG: hypothetical protein MSB12_00610 [Lentisphaeraceae bacterium]|nr:hypothetical protein [Lentisphaeraceae bacterium]